MKSVLTNYAHAFTTSLLTFGLGGSLGSSSAALANERPISGAPIVRSQGWLVSSYSAIENPMQEVDLRKERALLGTTLRSGRPKMSSGFAGGQPGGCLPLE